MKRGRRVFRVIGAAAYSLAVLSACFGPEADAAEHTADSPFAPVDTEVAAGPLAEQRRKIPLTVGPEPENEQEKPLPLLPPVEPGAFRNSIQLVPLDGAAWKVCSEHLIRQLQNTEMIDIALTREFAKWKVFEDEYVRFLYPDNPHITVTVEDEYHRPMLYDAEEGEDYRFGKIYCITLGGMTYCNLSLKKKNYFEDRICAVGDTVVYRKVAFYNGVAAQFEFLGDGNVLSAQMLGKDMLLSMWDWTNLPMMQEVYLKIAESVELKNGPCDREEIRRKVIDHEDFTGRLAFLEKGMRRDGIVALMGKPQEEARDSLTFVRRWKRDIFTVTVDLKDNVFYGFAKGWNKYERIPAERGSPEWLYETAEEIKITGRSDPDTIKYIFDRFAELAPAARGDDWFLVCQAVYDLSIKGFRDERVLPIVRKRVLEKENNQHYAAAALYKYDPEGSQELFVRRIEQVLAEKDPGSKFFQLAYLYGNLENLFGFLNKEHQKRTPLLLEALEHPNLYVRGTAFDLLETIPPQKAKPYLLKGLSDENDYIRSLCAHWFAKRAGDISDLDALKKCLTNEKDKEIREYLEKAIARIGAKADTAPQ